MTATQPAPRPLSEVRDDLNSMPARKAEAIRSMDADALHRLECQEKVLPVELAQAAIVTAQANADDWRAHEADVKETHAQAVAALEKATEELRRAEKRHENAEKAHKATLESLHKAETGRQAAHNSAEWLKSMVEDHIGGGAMLASGRHEDAIGHIEASDAALPPLRGKFGQLKEYHYWTLQSGQGE